MAIWDLTPGAERVLPRGASTMTKSGVGNLSPAEVADRCERWYGARVVHEGSHYKIYPADRSASPVFFDDRFDNGTGRSNTLTRLRRAGIDVLHDPRPAREDNEKMTKPQTNGVPTPAAMPRAVVAANTSEEGVLALLAEQDERIGKLTKNVSDLIDVVGKQKARLDELEGTVSRHAEIEHQNRGRYAAAIRRINVLEKQVAGVQTAPSAGESADARARREQAELVARAIEFLNTLPEGAAMSSGSLAASLNVPGKGNALGKGLAVAHRNKKVDMVVVGSQKMWRAKVSKKAEG